MWSSGTGRVVVECGPHDAGYGVRGEAGVRDIKVHGYVCNISHENIGNLTLKFLIYKIVCCYIIAISIHIRGGVGSYSIENERPLAGRAHTRSDLGCPRDR